MRIVTDGKRFAIARRRWIFTEFYSLYGKRWNSIFTNSHIKYPECYWTDYDDATKILNRLNARFKYYDYNGKINDTQ